MQGASVFLFFIWCCVSVRSQECIDGVCHNDAPNESLLQSLWTEGEWQAAFSLQSLEQSSLRTHFGSFVSADPLPVPFEIVDLNTDLLQQYWQLDSQKLTPSPTATDVDLLTGRLTPTGARSLAHRYGGHQFGVWAGQLGDGRAVSWGMQQAHEESPLAKVSPTGAWDWQLKGSGQTPYSRDGDGRAVLRSSIREYLGSWAAYHLNMPTSLCVGLVQSTTPQVKRDPLYNGQFILEPAAVTLRISPTWLRFGSFQLLYKNNEKKALKQLLSHTVRWYFPHLLKSDAERELAESLKLFDKKSARVDEIARDLLFDVVRRTAVMVAHWKTQGFVHGVMNTDNMSILGLTIDYGPFAFMDTFETGYVSNLSDDLGRYRFDGQENVGQWNLRQFADALSDFVSIANQVRALSDYFTTVKEAYSQLMGKRLGFLEHSPLDDTIVDALLEIMEKAKLDYHHFLRAMSASMGSSASPPKSLIRAFKDDKDSIRLFDSWWKFVGKRRDTYGPSVEEQRKVMRENNPIYVLRNHIAQKAIEDAANGDYSTVRTLRRILAAPFTKDTQLSPEEQVFYSSPPPPGSEPVKVSCSS